MAVIQEEVLVRLAVEVAELGHPDLHVFLQVALEGEELAFAILVLMGLRIQTLGHLQLFFHYLVFRVETPVVVVVAVLYQTIILHLVGILEIVPPHL